MKFSDHIRSICPATDWWAIYVDKGEHLACQVAVWGVAVVDEPSGPFDAVSGYIPSGQMGLTRAEEDSNFIGYVRADSEEAALEAARSFADG